MRVTFAYPLTTADGVTRAPDESADLPDDEARQLLKDGVARTADPDAPAIDPTPAPATRPAPRTKPAGGES